MNLIMISFGTMMKLLSPKAHYFDYFPELIPGETYLLKVTYGSGYSLTVDSCFTTFNYVSETHEENGMWVYRNTGTLAHPCGYYGFYNVIDNLEFNLEDYPDYSLEELEGEYALTRLHFTLQAIGFSYIKIEILQ